MVDLLALADLQAGTQSLCVIANIDGGNLLVIDEGTALLHQTASFGLGGNQLAGQQQIHNADAIADLLKEYVGEQIAVIFNAE